MRDLADRINVVIDDLRLPDMPAEEAAAAAELFRSGFETALAEGLENRDFTDLQDMSLPDLDLDLSGLEDPGALGAALADAVLRELFR